MCFGSCAGGEEPEGVLEMDPKGARNGNRSCGCDVGGDREDGEESM